MQKLQWQAVLVLLLSCCTHLSLSKRLGAALGTGIHSATKLPKGKRDIKKQGVKLSHIDSNARGKAPREYKPASAFNIKSIIGKVADPGSIVYHVSPPTLMFVLSQVTKTVDFTSSRIRALARVSMAAYLLLAQLFFWNLRRVIRVNGDDSLVVPPPRSLLDLLGGPRPPEVAEQTVMAYDLREVERLQSGMAVEASVMLFMLTLSFYKQLLWYLASSVISILRANVVLANLFHLSDEVKYPFLKRPFQSGIQALLSSYMNRAMGGLTSGSSEMSSEGALGEAFGKMMREVSVGAEGDSFDEDLDVLTKPDLDLSDSNIDDDALSGAFQEDFSDSNDTDDFNGELGKEEEIEESSALDEGDEEVEKEEDEGLYYDGPQGVDNTKHTTDDIAKKLESLSANLFKEIEDKRKGRHETKRE